MADAPTSEPRQGSAHYHLLRATTKWIAYRKAVQETATRAAGVRDARDRQLRHDAVDHEAAAKAKGA